MISREEVPKRNPKEGDREPVKDSSDPDESREKISDNTILFFKDFFYGRCHFIHGTRDRFIRVLMKLRTIRVDAADTSDEVSGVILEKLSENLSSEERPDKEKT